MLKRIVREIRNFEGITRKSNIRIVKDFFKNVQFSEKIEIGIGDDAAVLRNSDEYLIFSVDGVLPKLVREEPYAAGKASVMLNVNDIYAMGGRPIAMVNVISSSNIKRFQEILKGIAKGCEKFKVPMVGGHIHPDSEEDSLVVAIVGTAKHLLLSNTAKPGQRLILAVDLKGKTGCRTVKSWDSSSGKTSEEVLERLETLCLIAEKGLCKAAKDVSMGGILGTVAIFLESSGTGGKIYIDKIPKPRRIEMIDWLKAFLSFGFVLSADIEYVDEILRLFQIKKITANVIGEVKENRVV